jgi:hypothetical protein
MTARTSPSPLRIECGRRLVEQHQPQRDGDGAASPHSKLNPFVAPTAYRIALGHKIEDRNGEQKIVIVKRRADTIAYRTNLHSAVTRKRLSITST